MLKPNLAENLNVLDVTLRDGSYLIDFQFSQQDTSLICKALEAAGIDWIEIGHGVGLGASVKKPWQGRGHGRRIHHCSGRKP